MNIITLSNGKKVANFSSPHPFTFEDGNVLPAVSNEEAERLKIEFIEMPLDDTEGAKSGDVSLAFDITDEVRREIEKWEDADGLKQVDVVFCPLPMIIVLKEAYGLHWLVQSPFRAIRIEDRIKKLISIHKQTL